MHEKISPNAKVLIISWSPIPTPKYQKIEGSGQRFFGLATGLQKNGIKDITIAVGTIYPLDVDEVSGIKLFNYDFNDEFADKIAQYDTVIFNYAIHGSTFVFENLPEDTQVIVDAYGPAYIESLARDPEDMVNTYIGNLAAVNDVFNKILPRADFVLYANDAQEKLYTGVLATLGSINQFSYKTQKLLRVPLGIDKPDKSVRYENPYAEHGIKKDDFVLLWFGGLYPWFDITKILDTVKDLKQENLKFVIIGGNNPQNQHPDFVKHYHNTLKYIEENDIDDQVVLIDWVDFATRRKYYEYADAIISVNGEGKENVYSWRTRVMDYLGSQTPLITNGGDPLSDELIDVGAAFKIDSEDSKNIRGTIVDLVKDRKKIAAASEQMQNLQPKYYWETVTSILADTITEQAKPYGDEMDFRREHNLIDTGEPAVAAVRQRRSVVGLAGKAVRKTREIGVRATYKIAHDKVRRKATRVYREKFPKKTPQKPRIVIVSNQLNNTGAPFVIMDVISQIKAQHPELAASIKLIAFTPIESENIARMRKMGIKTEVYTNRELAIEFHEGDVVIFNSFAMSRTTVHSAMQAMNDGRLQKLFWYGHEAMPDSFVDLDTKRNLRKLLNEDKAKVLAVSNKTREEYVRFFQMEKNIEKMTFRFLFPEDKFRVRTEDEFTELRFAVTGSLMDMRKGQYPILYAFLDFYHNRYQKHPERYRDFQVKFTGAYQESDTGPEAAYHVQNIKKQFEESAKDLGDRFVMLPTLSHKESIEEIDASNVTICYSLLEAMGIFVYEGMATGHPIIRNESAGKDEQLVEGKNGLAVYNDHFAGLVEAIEQLLNKKKTSDKQLAKMSKASHDIAKEATQKEYFIIEEIADIFTGK